MVLTGSPWLSTKNRRDRTSGRLRAEWALGIFVHGRPGNRHETGIDGRARFVGNSSTRFPPTRLRGPLARRPYVVVTAIAERRWLGPTQEFRDVKRIITVLVVHDALWSSPGFGRFVAAEFDRALGRCEQMTPCEKLKSAVRVLVPIVLTVEDVELLEVSTEHFGLREVLLDYSDACPESYDVFPLLPGCVRQVLPSRSMRAAVWFRRQ